jgi:hypothetical protein
MSTWTARTQLARDQRRPAGFIQPCLLTLADKVPTGPDWQFEVKHDGLLLPSSTRAKWRLKRAR